MRNKESLIPEEWRAALAVLKISLCEGSSDEMNQFIVGQQNKRAERALRVAQASYSSGPDQEPLYRIGRGSNGGPIRLADHLR